ncbi:MAG: ABC transporter [Clostridia bacterium BRH_c25]|nr:MAG: ABC transporter [Clostridia bacterium BRH_c25]
MIEARGLSKSFGSFRALDNMSIHVKEASVYGLLGPNGAGKTTLIKHIMGLYRPDRGTVLVGGKPVYENIDMKSSIVYIPDELYFFSLYSIEDTARFYSTIYKSWNWDRYEHLKQVFQIDPKKKIIRLSKGMQKQVAFWLGICQMPGLMVLDEPVDGLDPIMRKKVWSLVLQDVSERKTSVLVSSHNLRELEDVCDHIGILHNGKIVVESELDSLKSDIHKIQVAYTGGIPAKLPEGGEILHHSQSGSVLLMIVKGDVERVLSSIKRTNPVIMDVLPLTLEEVFIYELGGLGYDIQSVII